MNDKSKLDRAGQSRMNGAKSNGPVTPEGKAKSSRNATRIGLHAQSPAAFPEIEQQEFQGILARYMDEFKPSRVPEQDLVRQLAFNRFRYYRIQRMEAQAFEQSLSASAGGGFDDSFDPGQPDALALRHLESRTPLFDLFQRALAALERTYLRTLKALDDRRRDVPQYNREPVEICWEDPESGELTHMATMEPGTYRTNLSDHGLTITLPPHIRDIFAPKEQPTPPEGTRIQAA